MVYEEPTIFEKLQELQDADPGLIGFPVRNSDGTITWKKLFGE